jgi:hypothetical protein
MTFMNAANSAPMAGARVLVFFNPPAPNMHAKVTLPQIGSGVTDSTGAVNLTLNTAAVPASALADVGSGNISFNSIIMAWDSSGQYNITNQIINEGRALTLNLRQGTNPATGRPAVKSAAQVQALDSYFSTPNRPMSKNAVYSKYRYSPITPLNSAPGLHVKLTYTYSTSVQKQSEFELPTTASGGVSLTSNQTEETDRSVKSGIKENDGYHRWVWANYHLVYYLICAPRNCYHEWEPDHFQGTVTDNNPNIHKGHTKPIGRVKFTQPKFDAGPGGNWAVPITRNSIPFERETGTRQENYNGIDFSLGKLPVVNNVQVAGGSLKLGTLMTYGSITDVSWSYKKGCPHTRYVWGVGTDPVAATRVMASCI